MNICRYNFYSYTNSMLFLLTSLYHIHFIILYQVGTLYLSCALCFTFNNMKCYIPMKIRPLIYQNSLVNSHCFLQHFLLPRSPCVFHFKFHISLCYYTCLTAQSAVKQVIFTIFKCSPEVTSSGKFFFFFFLHIIYIYSLSDVNI